MQVLQGIAMSPPSTVMSSVVETSPCSFVNERRPFEKDNG